MNKLNKFISLNFNKIITFILIFNPIIDLLNSIFINNLHLNFTFGVVVRIIFLLFFIYCLLNLKETNKKNKILIFIIGLYLLMFLGLEYFNDSTIIFIQELKMSYPEIELLGVQSSFDEMSEVEKIVENTIEIAPDLTGIFVVSGGQAGVCKAMQKLNMETRPYVIGYDVTPTNIKALKEGTYDFLIDQEGFEQGYRPPHLLYNMIRKGEKIEKEYAYTDISIKTKYNL